MLNENVKKLLKAGMWNLVTCAGEMIERIKERYKNYLYIEACPRIRPTSPSTSSTASGGWKTARRFKFAATAINGKSAGHRIFSAACFSSAAKGDIMGTGKVFFCKMEGRIMSLEKAKKYLESKGCLNWKKCATPRAG